VSTAEVPVILRVVGRLRSSRGIFTETRVWIYLSCTTLAVLASYLLGKEMMWDTLDYHFYGAFSVLHDRFDRDYFAAGLQSYLNPYIYVPFYLLVRTGLPALWVASILAAVQSVILWLTYELAVAVGPPDDPRFRASAGTCAALFALANPILIDQLGSSYSDITTAEIVLAGWLLLVLALRTPRVPRVLCAGLLLGAASALKPTNALHALSACVLLLFLPTGWRRKTWLAFGFLAALIVSFVAVAAPWALRLEQHFGNPFFPLFNGVFHSPYFPAVSLADHRFVPSSLLEALSRPFAIALPITYVDDEYSSPDIRYALLLVLALVGGILWSWRKFRRGTGSDTPLHGTAPAHGLLALACAFLVDWVLWLRVSGNGRYFLAMACVGGVLAVVLACRIFATRRHILVFLLVAIFVVQGVQLAWGAKYRASASWDGGSWFEVSVPRGLQNSPQLYFLMDDQTDSFIAPFLDDNSAFVNLDGTYALGPDGVNGARIESLIREHAGHIRVVEEASPFELRPVKELPEPSQVNYALASFGLRADRSDCSTITVRDIRARVRKVLPGTLPIRVPQLDGKVLWVPQSPDGDLVTCRVVSDPTSRVALANAEREPNLVFDRMEDECPQLFQPLRPVIKVYEGDHGGTIWAREYANTNLTALLSEGTLRLVDGTRGGRPEMLGSESDWVRAPVPLVCGRDGEHYFARIAASGR